MGTRDESTETIVRRHVKKHVEREMEPYKAKIEADTCRVVASCTDQLDHIKQVQDQHHKTLFGKMPPDPKDPGVWRASQDNTAFVAKLKAVGWKFLLGIAGAAGVAAWALL